MDLNIYHYYYKKQQQTHPQNVSLSQPNDPRYGYALRDGGVVWGGAKYCPSGKLDATGRCAPPRAKEVDGFLDGFLEKSLAKNIHFYYKLIINISINL